MATDYPLEHDPIAEIMVDVSIGGQHQIAGVNFTLETNEASPSGKVLRFKSPPPKGAVIGGKGSRPSEVSSIPGAEFVSSADGNVQADIDRLGSPAYLRLHARTKGLSLERPSKLNRNSGGSRFAETMRAFDV